MFSLSDATCIKDDTIRVRVSSANVRSLQPHQEAKSYARIAGEQLRMKTEVLQTLFHEHNMDIVGVQEGTCCLDVLNILNTY